MLLPAVCAALTCMACCVAPCCAVLLPVLSLHSEDDIEDIQRVSAVTSSQNRSRLQLMLCAYGVKHCYASLISVVGDGDGDVDCVIHDVTSDGRAAQGHTPLCV